MRKPLGLPRPHFLRNDASGNQPPALRSCLIYFDNKFWISEYIFYNLFMTLKTFIPDIYILNKLILLSEYNEKIFDKIIFIAHTDGNFFYCFVK